ncbi:hypothetical protein M413DRAFT_218140 [Hebeloma cylindrosporum]|uniref:Tim10-like domain-containing protein n=1 Tax=Hebeloma cylindrosporum TaxID=76867 RepID=A0A0C2YE11_HEBCY|nr:hypothetical protein M413DRAFT_218140 [Hebeloma cylindrosporum h7]
MRNRTIEDLRRIETMGTKKVYSASQRPVEEKTRENKRDRFACLPRTIYLSSYNYRGRLESEGQRRIPFCRKRLSFLGIHQSSITSAASAARNFENRLQTYLLLLLLLAMDLQFNDETKKELATFIEREQAQAKMNSSIHTLTATCWDKCVTGTPSTSFSRSESSCLANCVDRFLDTSLYLVKQISEQREHGR